MTFTELQKFDRSNRFTILDNNKDFSLYRSEYYFRGTSEYTTYLVDNSSDEYKEIKSNRIKTVKGAINSLS